MDISKIIAANLTAWMNETPGLDTLQKLEVKSGIGFGTIRRAKNGEGNITIEKLTALAAAFGRHPAEMMIEPPATDGLLPDSIQENIEKTPSTVATLKPATERDRALADLLAVVAGLDTRNLFKLTERATMLLAEQPAKQTPASTG